MQDIAETLKIYHYKKHNYVRTITKDNNLKWYCFCYIYFNIVIVKIVNLSN